MFKKFSFCFIMLFIFFIFNASAVQTSTIQNNNNELLPENTLYIELKDGIVIAELFPKIAPMHVQRIKILTKDGFYDNVKFHRVISGFMAQTGDPTGTGKGGSRLGKLYAEFNTEHHIRGTLSMARASDPNSANSQFFIVTGDFFPELDGQYTIFGRVIDGMKYVDKIKVGNTENNGMVDNPDIMIRAITGDMLNNKSVSQIKKEIKIINKVQNDRLNEDPNYKKKSIIDLLVQTKDTMSEKSSESISDKVKEKTIQDNINKIQDEKNIQDTLNTQNNLNIITRDNNDIAINNVSEINTKTLEVPQLPTNFETPELPKDEDNMPNQPSTPKLPSSFETPSVPDSQMFDNQNNDKKNDSDNNPLSELDDLGLDLQSYYQPQAEKCKII